MIFFNITIKDAGVGKSSLVLRFVSDTFNACSESTIGYVDRLIDIS